MNPVHVIVKKMPSWVITMLMVLLAATWQLVSPHLPGDRGSRED